MRQLLHTIGQFLFGHRANNAERSMIEPLESRQFLSISPIVSDPCAVDLCTQHAIAAAEFNPTDVMGKWKGTIQTNLRPRPFKATINLTGITAARRVRGTVSIPFLLSNYKFAINPRKSRINPDGTFSVQFSKYGITAKFSGHYDDIAKHVVGDFNATAPGKTVFGTFDFARI